MEGSGQPQGPTTLPWEKEPSVFTKLEAGWAPTAGWYIVANRKMSYL